MVSSVSFRCMNSLLLHYRQLAQTPLQTLVVKAVRGMCWGKGVDYTLSAQLCRKACWILIRQAAAARCAGGLQQPRAREVSGLSLGARSTLSLNVFTLMMCSLSSDQGCTWSGLHLPSDLQMQAQRAQRMAQACFSAQSREDYCT